MVNESILFEQVVAHLLKAKHNVKINCKYNGRTRKRQFDGYHEELLEDYQTIIRIGIECRKKSRKCTLNDIEAFSKKIQRCKIDKGIMVSFCGYQAGALDEARESSIALLEFRPCIVTDFHQGTKIIEFDPIKEGQWRVKLGVAIEKTPHLDLDREAKQFAGAMENYHAVSVYDKDQNKIGLLSKIVSDIIDREVLLHGKVEGFLNIDWSTKDFYVFHTKQGTPIQITNIEIEYQFPIKQIKPFNPSNWYIMKNVLDNTRRLISTTKVREIERLYH